MQGGRCRGSVQGLGAGVGGWELRQGQDAVSVCQGVSAGGGGRGTQ